MRARNLFAAMLGASALFSQLVSAEMMTVRQLKALYESGQPGQALAISYVQGAIDGMLGMDSLAQKESGAKPQWCKVENAKQSGESIRHPAFRTGEFLRAWEKQGKSLDTIGPDFVLAILDSFYGCRRGPPQ